MALGMTGVVAISDNLSELILVVQSEMRRLGGEYSLRDGARIASELGEIHKKEMK